MSHHFDTPTAREDPRINVNDMYLFPGAVGMTVMAMTVNPDAGVSAPETFRDEAIYAFRFDLNGDHREEVTFKVKFDDVTHANGDEHKHVQRFQIRRATGLAALRGNEGELIIEGQTGEVVRAKMGRWLSPALPLTCSQGTARRSASFEMPCSRKTGLIPTRF